MRSKTLAVLLALICATSAHAADYVIAVSHATHSDPAWKPVVEALKGRHAEKGVHVAVYKSDVGDVLAELREHHPRFTCFVATPAEATRAFVGKVHRLTRHLDDDPYTDTRWGVLTGFDAANALRIAKHDKPLTIRKAASGTEIELDLLQQGIWYCELNKNHMVRKGKDGKPAAGSGPSDTTKALVDTLNEFHADLFVTSGHATERDWQIGYRYKNGTFRSKAGELFGLDTKGNRYPIKSDNPKVYMPIGNCLMGHIDGKDAMALAWMNSAGVNQMIGYTVVTWYGYGGWGVLDYFVEQPGRYTFQEAFHVNHHALIHRLTTNFPTFAAAEMDERGRIRLTQRPQLSDNARRAGLRLQDGQGLRFDRDVVAFYGDPAWEARVAPNKLAWDQKLTVKDGLYTLTITPKRGSDTFKPINTNGAQRGFRPIVELLPHRVKDIKVVKGADLSPVVTDDFVLIPLPRTTDVKDVYTVSFRATPVE